VPGPSYASPVWIGTGWPIAEMFANATSGDMFHRKFCTGPAIRSTGANLITEIVGTAVLMFGILAIAANAQTLARPGDVDLSVVFSRGLQPLLVGVLQFPIPSARRCYKLGQSLRRAIESYPEDLKVAIVATGMLALNVPISARNSPTKPEVPGRPTFARVKIRNTSA